jgi:hypothetical protein
MFPAVDWWEYKLFCMRDGGRLAALRQALRLGTDLLLDVPLRRKWCGLGAFDVDPRVELKRFILRPDLRDLQEGVTVVQHTYVLGQAFRNGSPRPPLKVVGALHVNLEKAIQSPSREAEAWLATAEAYEEANRERLQSTLRRRGEVAARIAHLEEDWLWNQAQMEKALEAIPPSPA